MVFVLDLDDQMTERRVKESLMINLSSFQTNRFHKLISYWVPARPVPAQEVVLGLCHRRVRGFIFNGGSGASPARP